ncbi:odorant receptor 2a-like [Calliphora vicina]|uniref:odorant receptor 2a-like n=1 Tax=Calliphora vicina TaxID=7373 RepID=UPI00325B0F6B
MQLKRPIDLGQPLDSVYGVKYLWLNWSVVGMNPPASISSLWLLLYYMYSAVINFLGSFCLPASMLANLFFINSWQALVGNLSLSITISMATLKQLVVLRHRRRLLKSNGFLKPLDERSSHHPQDRMDILNGIRTCHLYYVSYMTTYIFCAVGFSYVGWSNHQLIYNSWFPTIFANSQSNYLLAFSHQIMAQMVLVFQNGNNDIYPMCYLSLVTAHLESLANRISRIGMEKRQRSVAENIEELRLCILDHKNLLGYFECIRPVISITLFLQFFITAFVLCLTAINIIAFNHDLTQQFFVIVYLVIVLIQVFPCCWHVNVLMHKSDLLTTAMYSCNWMDQNQEFRKMLIIFMQRSQKTNTILAGNLAPVTLQTFLAILRISFSMFTIFSKV